MMSQKAPGTVFPLLKAQPWRPKNDNTEKNPQLTWRVCVCVDSVTTPALALPSPLCLTWFTLLTSHTCTSPEISMATKTTDSFSTACSRTYLCLLDHFALYLTLPVLDLSLPWLPGKLSCLWSPFSVPISACVVCIKGVCTRRRVALGSLHAFWQNEEKKTTQKCFVSIFNHPEPL